MRRARGSFAWGAAMVASLLAPPVVAQPRSLQPAVVVIPASGPRLISLRVIPPEAAGPPSSEGTPPAWRAQVCGALPAAGGPNALGQPQSPCRNAGLGPLALVVNQGGALTVRLTAAQWLAVVAKAPEVPHLVLSFTQRDGTKLWFAVRLESAPTPDGPPKLSASAVPLDRQNSLVLGSGAADPDTTASDATGAEGQAGEPQGAMPGRAAPSGLAPSFVAPVVSGRAVDAEPDHEPGQLLVLWPTQAEADAGLALLASRYRQRPRLLLPLQALGVVIAQLQLPDTRAALALRDTLRAEQPGWVSDLNARSSLQAGPPAAPPPPVTPAPPGPVTGPPPRLYALKQLQLGAVPPAAATAPLKLGVVDAALDPALTLHTSARAQRSVLGPADVPAPIDHGAVVAQLIAGPPLANGFAGAASALNPGIHLLWASAVRQVNGQPRSHSLHTLAALDWLLAQGAQLINLSLGGVGDAVLEAGVARLRERPVLLVAAAGNNGPDAPPVYPAAYPNVLAVTAIDAARQPYARANRGPYVGVAAPGVEVWVPVPAGSGSAAGTGASAGQYVSGTSFATALVTATLARASAAWWQQPKAAQLASLCRSVQDLGAAGRDPVFGCGLLDGSQLSGGR